MFDNFILSNKNPIEYLITPVAPYYICNHFIATEIHNNSGDKFICANIDIKANDLLKNQNYDDIKNFDIIQVQVDFFDYFYDNILPIIIKNNVKVIIITSQWHLPQIHKNYKTDELLKNNNVLLWVSQNPIYTNNKKYMALPYGICHININNYVDFIKSININNDKQIKILNQYSSVHSHLPDNHIRRIYDIFGKNSGQRLDYITYLTNILNSEFVISTSGDRDDCYRHYECIGLNAIPVSNINNFYKDIFEDNMIYSNAEEMINMINSNTVNYNYKKTNRDLLTIAYWVSKINELVKNNLEVVKDYWNKQPCNINHSSNPKETKEYFDEVETKKYFVEPHIPGFADFNKWKDKEVLELGCGIGTDSINFARAGAKLTVVDISNVSLDICKKRFDIYGFTATFICESIETIDTIIKDKKFDLIYSFGVIHHTVEPKNVINCVKNLLSEDGEFRFMVYSKVSYKLFWLMMENKITDINEGFNLVRNQSEAQKDCPITHIYDFNEIETKLLDDSFKIKRIWKDHIFIYDIDNYKKHIYIKDKYWCNTTNEEIQQLSKELGWHTMVIAY